MKYVFVLMLLGSDQETGEIRWDEAVRSKPISFQICIENVVDTVNTLDDAGIRYKVWCEPAQKKENGE